jgi:hypothetical protein
MKHLEWLARFRLALQRHLMEQFELLGHNLIFVIFNTFQDVGVGG